MNPIVVNSSRNMLKFMTTVRALIWLCGFQEWQSTMLAMSLDEKKLDMLQEWIVKYCGMSYKKVSILRKEHI